MGAGDFAKRRFGQVIYTAEASFEHYAHDMLVRNYIFCRCYDYDKSFENVADAVSVTLSENFKTCAIMNERDVIDIFDCGL